MADLIASWGGSLQGIPAPPPPKTAPSGKAAPSWNTVSDWLTEIARQRGLMRASTPSYQRFDRTARWLTAARIRACTDQEVMTALGGILRQARYPGNAIHGLDRVWSRAELGVLVTEATNRARQLAMGRKDPRRRGPRLDPAYLPDDRLNFLIQRHANLQFVEVLRTERRRRDSCRLETLRE